MVVMVMVDWEAAAKVGEVVKVLWRVIAFGCDNVHSPTPRQDDIQISPNCWQYIYILDHYINPIDICPPIFCSIYPIQIYIYNKTYTCTIDCALKHKDEKFVIWIGGHSSNPWGVIIRYDSINHFKGGWGGANFFSDVSHCLCLRPLATVPKCPSRVLVGL